jgi:hypothetical protein
MCGVTDTDVISVAGRLLRGKKVNGIDCMVGRLNAGCFSKISALDLLAPHASSDLTEYRLR